MSALKLALIERAAVALQRTKPPYPAIFVGLFFATSMTAPVLVPVPLDHGADAFKTVDDLVVEPWLALHHRPVPSAGAIIQYRNGQRFQLDTNGADCSLWVFLKTTRNDDFLNLALFPTGTAPDTSVHGDILLVKEHEGEVRDLTLADELWARQMFFE
ncbi:hypothetical protein C8J57DRAFT_1506086 [Mycena rebaudengoi]|nr:hypothetical protein C8J57DRAFT_1506086 [Mycena rebaudengoi]